MLASVVLLSMTGASQAIVAQSDSAAGSNSAATPAARPVNRHWSLPFDGRLKAIGEPGASGVDAHRSPPVTVLHLDEPQLDQSQPETPHSVQAQLPSAVTLTPQPQERNVKAAAMQSPDGISGATKPVVPEAKVTTDTKVTASDTALAKDSKVQAEEQRQQPAKSVKDDQTPKLRPPIGDQSLESSSPKKIISGEVSTWEGPLDVDRIVNSLVDKNFQQSPEAQKIDKQLHRLSSPTQKVIAVTKDSLNNTFEYQGFDPSARAGKLILDENYKLRNKSWAEYERQKYVDKIHLQVVSSMMQIAEALGMTEGGRAALLLAEGQDSLGALVGKDESAKTVQGLKTWLGHVPASASSFSQTPWNTIERNKKLEAVLREALKQDPVVAETTKKLERYAHPGAIKSGSSRVVETTLNAISILGPGFAIPIGAEVANTGFKQSTGGSEENKLEKELLLDKRIQSRLRVLSQEAALALDNYRFALVTKNPTLLVFSEEILGNITGRSNLPKIVSAESSATDNPPIVPGIIESTKGSKTRHALPPKQ